MARLMAVANGNNTDAATWAVIDSTSYVESEAQSTTIGTTYNTSYTQFTPGAITTDGAAIRISTRSGTTGTLTVGLYNHTAGAIVATSEVTVNITDVVDSNNTAVDGGWMFFKFAAPILLLGANNYSVVFKTSNASQLSVFQSGSSTPSKFLRTTTTQAPVAGDDRFVMGEWTAAATMTSRTVTLNDTVLVDYGSASTSQVTPALSISNGGIVLAGTTAATTYVQKISGNVVVYNGGILRLATSGSRMPSTSSFTWTFDCGANVDFGIDVRRKGEFTAYGEQKTRWTLLTGDEAAAQTVIGVVDTTGWKVGDTLVFAATGTTTTQGETKVIQTVDSGVQVTLTAGLTNAHTGTGNVVGEVGNLTSNVTILGTSTTVGTFICFKDLALGVLDNVEVRYYGSGTANKRGVESQLTTSSVNTVTFNNCSFRDSMSNSFVGTTTTGASHYTITNNILCGSTTTSGQMIIGGGTTGASNTAFTVTGNLLAGGIGVTASVGITMSAVTSYPGTTFGTVNVSSNRIAGCSTGLAISATLIDIICSITISDTITHSCTTGMTGTSGFNKILNNLTANRCSNGINTLGGIVTFNSCTFKGNSSAGYNVSVVLPGVVTFNDSVFSGDTGFNQSYGIMLATNSSLFTKVIFNACTFGVGVAHSQYDLYYTTYQSVGDVIFNSCTLASTNETNTISNIAGFLGNEAKVSFVRKDNVDGNNSLIVRTGYITSDSVIFRTSSPSLRIVTYGDTSGNYSSYTKLLPFKAYVDNGQTCTPTVYVRESAAGDGATYAGSRVKLYVKANYNLGITSDTLLATATAASDGAWEALSGTTAAVTDNGVLEFYLRFDGSSTGWVNWDDFSFVNA